MKISLINWHLKPKNTPLGAVPCAGLEAVYEGLTACGHSVRRTSNLCSISEGTVACWGWRRQIVGALQRLRKNILVAELGYIGDRRKNISLGWNGLNGHATFPEYPDDGGERFRAFGGEIKHWKKDGEYILILGQVKDDASLKGQDIMPWYMEQARKASEYYGIPVYYRPHPESVRRRGYESLDGFNNMGGTLQEAIGGALFTIAYNSNSCLDSLLEGVPCFAGDKGTLVWDLCMRDIKEIVYPDREKIIHQIAWKQWTIDEIKSGKPFERLFA